MLLIVVFCRNFELKIYKHVVFWEHLSETLCSSHQKEMLESVNFNCFRWLVWYLCVRKYIWTVLPQMMSSFSKACLYDQGIIFLCTCFYNCQISYENSRPILKTVKQVYGPFSQLKPTFDMDYIPVGLLGLRVSKLTEWKRTSLKSGRHLSNAHSRPVFLRKHWNFASVNSRSQEQLCSIQAHLLFI